MDRRVKVKKTYDVYDQDPEHKVVVRLLGEYEPSGKGLSGLEAAIAEWKLAIDAALGIASKVLGVEVAQDYDGESWLLVNRNSITFQLNCVGVKRKSHLSALRACGALQSRGFVKW